MTTEKETKATLFGIILLVIFILVLTIIPMLVSDQIINYLAFSIFGIFKLWLIFYGQTIVKKLNRNYTGWSALLFFFTSISLIILGQLPKLKREVTILRFEPSKQNKNPNNLPDIIFWINSSIILESIQNDVFTLNYMIKNYKELIKENTTLFPILAAYQLNKNELFSDETLKILNTYSSENNFESFNHHLDALTKMSPEEVAKKYI